MAGSLIKIAETTVSSATASVTLTGIDSTYDVYMFVTNNVHSANDGVNPFLRFTSSGTEDSSANYDYAFKNLRTDTTFGNESVTNDNEINLDNLGNATGEAFNCVIYLFNFNNSSEYSFMTLEGANINSSGVFKGRQGGGVLTVAQATDGVKFFMSSGDIDSGKFKLYGLKK